MSKLYLVTRRDLMSGLAAAQIAHAAIEWATTRPPLEVERWKAESNTVVLLAVSGEPELASLLSKAGHGGVGFRDPDIGNELTAIALDPNNKSKKLCRGLKVFS